MEILGNNLIEGPHGKPILLDLYFDRNTHQQPLVIFTHGFKGFKDWGHFDLMAQTFTRHGAAFIKYNLSHNGTTPDAPAEFTDLEAFGNNNFLIELDDLGAVIDWGLSESEPARDGLLDKNKLFLIGHSRGGGITILKANEDSRISKIATWASVVEFGQYWTHSLMERWKKHGVHYVQNSRTGQQMPLYWQLYESYFNNLDRLHIPSAVKSLDIPYLAIHGTEDKAVPYESLNSLKKWNDQVQTVTIEGGDHVFGARHPWDNINLPSPADEVIHKTLEFFGLTNQVEDTNFSR